MPAAVDPGAIICGDARAVAATLKPGSVQAIVTSPPYFGLRDYGGEPAIWGGRRQCDHDFEPAPPRRWRRESELLVQSSKQASNRGATPSLEATKICRSCGAWLGCLGMEPTAKMYVRNLLEVAWALKRVLSDSGVMFLNIGPTWAAGSGSCGYPPKSLILIPAMVALALQEDGWLLRSEIIWEVTNRMPESVADRPSRAHEQIFLFAKRPNYFYDSEGVRVATTPATRTRYQYGHSPDGKHRGVTDHRIMGKWLDKPPAGGQREWRKLRSVWSFASANGSDGHYGAFPIELPRRCILLSTRPGDLVLDPFAGSGTTLCAAKALGRPYIGIEQSADYCASARRRLAATQDGLPV